MNWHTNLKPSEKAYVINILDQIPNKMGERDAFIKVLDRIAGEGSTPKWAHLLVTPDYAVYGTNNETAAIEAFDNDYIHLDVAKGTCDGRDIQKYTPPDEDNEEEDEE